MSRIRAALLGYGRTASSMHIGAYEANADRFDVTAVCDIEPARLREAAERIPQATRYDDYHEMLERERPELVSVLTRSDQHAAMTIECLEAGANVVVTKPWAVNADEAERMCEAEQRTGKMLLPWLPARWGSDLARLRELVADGAIGKVFLIRRAVRSFGTRSDWQTERRYGGGYLLNWGPHIIDPPVLLAGSPLRLARLAGPGRPRHNCRERRPPHALPEHARRAGRPHEAHHDAIRERAGSRGGTRRAPLRRREADLRRDRPSPARRTGVPGHAQPCSGIVARFRCCPLGRPGESRGDVVTSPARTQ